MDSDLKKVQSELQIARSEIANVRRHLKSFKIQQDKAICNIRKQLNEFRCNNCLRQNVVNLKPIGWISTDFPEKKSIPRQSAINLRSTGKIIFDKTVLTNPNHALEGVEKFSHFWLVYYFNELESKRVPAKVAPPRLNGGKLGVFATRSPHRPCPIGLSLVQLETVGVDFVTFFGVDMLDKTPVLDIKPYIPFYDCVKSEDDFRKDLHQNEVSLPEWITNSPEIDVKFSENALISLTDICANDVDGQKAKIINILKQDPRFAQYAESASRPTFNSIESVVKTISGIASLLDTTFYSMMTTFRTIISVADNFNNLRSMFARIWTSLAIVRFLRVLARRILILLRLRRRDDPRHIAWQQASINDPMSPVNSDQLSQWPVLLYFSLVLFGPFLFTKLIHSSTPSQSDLGSTKDLRAAAICDFLPSRNDELRLHKGQTVEIAPRAVQEKKNLCNSGWVLVRSGDNYGLVPLNHLQIFD